MLKLIIATSDLLKCKELINQCISSLPTLQIHKIITTDFELKYYVKKSKFDIILFYNFDYSDFDIDNYNVICIDNFKTPVKKYEKRISLSEVNSMEVLKKHLQVFINKVTLSTINQNATDTLLQLGFSFKHIGTKYILDAVCYACTKNCDDTLKNFEKEIYPYLAELHNTTIDKVRWSIIRTVNLMYANHTTKTLLDLEEFFCLDHLQKPTPKLVICLISTKLLFKSSF